MYDQSLEQLIDAVIADGVITDQERNVVYKKAASLGIDRDEIEVYLNGKLHALNNTNKTPKSGKHGVVKTCPNCGATVEGGSAKCKECGYAFTGIEANSSAKELDARLRGISSDNNAFASILSLGKKKAEIITSFPIPNTRDDLLEFITSIEPKINNTTGYECQAYRMKYQECINKFKLSFPNDPILQSYGNKVDAAKKKDIKTAILLVSILVLIPLILLLLGSIL